MDVLIVYLSDGKRHYVTTRYDRQAGIAAKLVEKSIDRLARKLGLAAPRLARSSARQWPSACYGKIVEGIQTRILQLAE